MGRGLIALVGVALALVVAGCGGGSSSSDPNAISKEAFTNKADAICQQGNERMQKDLTSALASVKNEKRIIGIIKHPSKADYELVINKVLIPNLEWEIKEIRKLGAPSGDEDRIEEILKALEEGIETAEDDPQAVISSSDAIFGIAARLAGEYGLTTCSSR